MADLVHTSAARKDVGVSRWKEASAPWFEMMLKLQRERSVSARRHAVSGELIGAGNEVRDRGILITESNQFRETKLAIPPPPPS